jgi:hypothetical protein
VFEADARRRTLLALMQETAGCARLDTMTDRSADIHAIIQVSLSYAAGIDHRDWPRYRSVFHDECHFDTSSWSGRPPTTMAADDWVDAVRAVNGNFDATQHLMTNHTVEFVGDDEAIGVNEVHAQHWFSAATMAEFGRPSEPAWCVLGGHYRNRYRRVEGVWRMSECQLTVRWQTGNSDVFALARTRTVTK